MLDSSPLLERKISPLIEGQVPDFIQANHNIFVTFLKSYYKFLESAELKVSVSIDSLIGEEQDTTYILMEGSTNSSEEDIGEKIILETGAGSTGKFVNNEIITGQTSKATATVHVEDTSNGRIFISANKKLLEGETIIGSISTAQATVTTYTPNPVQNIQQLIEYSTPDNTLDKLLDNFRKMFMSVIPLTIASNLSKRKLLKAIRELYTAKGTSEGHKFFLRLLLDEEASILYPEKFMMRISGGDWNTPQTVRTTNGGFPEDRDITEFVGQTATGVTSGATVILVAGEVRKFNTNNVDENFWEYEIDPNSITGNFLVGEEVSVVSKTNNYIYKFTLANRVTDINLTSGGILYNNNDLVNSDDLFANAFGGFQISSTKVGSVSEVIIDDAGTGYAEGDNLVFNSGGQSNTASAVAKVSVISGMLTLEDGNQILVETGENTIVEQTDISLESGTTGFDSNSPYNRILLESSVGIGVSADSLIYETKLNTISMPQVSSTYKDGIVLEPDTTSGDSDHKGIRKINFINGGAGYSSLPTVSVTSSGGSGTKILANTNNIGSIQDIDINLSTGLANDAVPKLIIPKVHAIVKDITGSILVTGTFTSGGQGTIENFDSTKQIISIQPTIVPNSNIIMETASDILLEDGGVIIREEAFHNGETGTLTTNNGATAKIVNINSANATTTLGLFSNKVGAYPIDKLSTLGEAKVRIQDSKYYQQFSYEVQVGAGLSQYINELRKAVHPSGFNIFGKVSIATQVAAGINVITGRSAPGYTGDDTFTPELASLFTRVFDNRLVSRRLGTVDDGTSINFTNLEEGLTQNGTVADQQIITAGSAASDITVTERAQNIVLAAEMDLPSSFTRASCIWECGGTGVGSWFGISKQSGEYFLRLRAGDGSGSSNIPNTTLAIAQVAVSSLPQYFDGNTHTLVWDITINPGRTRIFIDGQLVAEGTTSDGTSLPNNGFAGGADGKFGSFELTIAGDDVVNGSTQFQAKIAFDGTIRSSLRMYKGGQVITADISQQTSKITALDNDDILTNTSIGFKSNKRDLTLSKTTKVTFGKLVPNFPNNNALQILNKFPFLTRSGRIDLETKTHEQDATSTFDSTTTKFDDNTPPPSFDVGPAFARGVIAIDAIPSNLSATIVNLGGSSSSISQLNSSQGDSILLESGADTSTGAVLSQIGSIVFTDIFQYHVVQQEEGTSNSTDQSISLLLEDGDDLLLEDQFQRTSRLDFPPSVYTDVKEKAFTYPSVINIS